MSEEKKYTNNEELCEGITKITEEDLEQVTGGKGDKVLSEGDTFSLETVYTK